MNIRHLSNRSVSATIALLCLTLIVIALYMQHVMGLNPCYLCITQRVFIIAIGVIALAFFLHNPATTGSRIYSAIMTLLAAGGGFFAIKQLWLQSLPEDRVPACGPPADYLFEVFSFNEALSMLLQGDGNCAKVQWTLFGISIPGWTLAAFIFFFLTSLWLLARKK